MCRKSFIFILLITCFLNIYVNNLTIIFKNSLVKKSTHRFRTEINKITGEHIQTIIFLRTYFKKSKNKNDYIFY